MRATTPLATAGVSILPSRCTSEIPAPAPRNQIGGAAHRNLHRGARIGLAFHVSGRSRDPLRQIPAMRLTLAHRPPAKERTNNGRFDPTARDDPATRPG